MNCLQIISGQSLPLPADTTLDDARLYVEASILVPELSVEVDSTIPQTPSTASGTTDILKYRTRVVAYNTYNPRWNDTLNLRFDTYDSMLDLCFLRIEVKNQISVSEDATVAHFCASLGSLERGELSKVSSTRCG